MQNIVLYYTMKYTQKSVRVNNKRSKNKSRMIKKGGAGLRMRNEILRKISKLERTNSQFKKINSELLEKISKLEKKNTDTMNRLNFVKDSETLLIRNMNKQEEEISKLEEEISKLEEEISKLKEENATLKSSENKTNNEIIQKNIIIQLKKEIRKLGKELKELKELKQLKKQFYNNNEVSYNDNNAESRLNKILKTMYEIPAARDRDGLSAAAPPDYIDHAGRAVADSGSQPAGWYD